VTPRPAATVFIFITVLLDILAIGLIIPVLPRLVESLTGGQTARAAEWMAVFGTGFAAMQFVVAPVLGALSDRFGRRPIILLSNGVLAANYIAMALAPSVLWLLAARLVAGGASASIATAGAYIADVTPPEGRAKAFGLLGAAFGVGFVLGPAFGGWLGNDDPRLPFWVAAGLSAANFAYGALVLPESLAPANRTALRLERATPWRALAMLRTTPGVAGLAGVFFLANLAQEVLPAVAVLYTGYRYGWDAATMGLALALVGVCSALVQGRLVGPVVARIGERRALLVGLGFGALGMTAYGLAPTGAWFWAAIPVMSLWGFATPAVQSLLSAQVGPDAQGRLQGALSSLRSIGGMIGPTVFALSFASSIEPGIDLPGLAFWMAGAVLAAASVLAWRVGGR
jgi:DHA1 family tetracycline resistance protein-like MFS transporter